MATDTDIILHALQRERDELHERIMQVDRIISRVRKIDYNHEAQIIPANEPARVEAGRDEPDKTLSFPKSADIKIQVLRIFDIVGMAAPLSDIQTEFTNITGNTYKIREAVRSLHSVGVVKMLKFKTASRGFMWVKTDWIENNTLMDKYKPIGFDMLYKPETLMFQ